MRFVGPVAVAATIACGLAAPRAGAQPTADYYKGKQVELIVGSEVGSGYDTYARVFGKNLGRHLPGAPAIVVKNMPGAVSRQATNYIYNIAPKDGTSIGAMIHGIVIDQLLGAAGVRYDTRKLTWLGSITRDLIVGVVWHTSPVKSVEDAMKHEVIVGGVADSLVYARLMNAVLGTKFKIITGYRGGAAHSQAMERGEIEGRMGWAWASMMSGNPEWLRDHKINVIVQFATSPHPAVPKVPVITDFVHNDDDRALLELVFSRQTLGKPVIAPPGLQPEVAAMLRKGFDDTMRDPGFKADMEKARLDLSPMSGAEVDALVERLFKTPAAIIDRAKTVIPLEQ
jgi:tripartite-type tricarboxylate transporter receptor subunit TctC